MTHAVVPKRATAYPFVIMNVKFTTMILASMATLGYGM